MNMDEVSYAGFWIRVAAAIVDSILLLAILAPLLTAIYGASYWTGGAAGLLWWNFILNYIAPAAAVILFWIYKSATPGKMLFSLVIVDASTGARPSVGQSIGRYFGYYVSMLPLFLGIFWVGFDKRKQGWHDKLAGTVVIKKPLQS